MAKAKKKEFKDRHGVLTLSDRFYIEQHGKDSPQALAEALEKPLDAVSDYFDYLAHLPRPKGKPKALDFMDRPAKGVISMTPTASAEGDNKRYNKYVTREAIEQARATGDFEGAKSLEARLAQEEAQTREVIKTKYSGMIHHIVPPDGDEDE